MLRKFSLSLPLLAALVLSIFVGVSNAGNHAKKDIVDTAVSNSDFSTLVTAVQAADLVEALKSEGPYTVFAPTNAAFDKIPAETLQTLLEDKEALRAVLTYHVVPGVVLAKDVVNLSTATTINGKDIQITTDNGVMVNNAKVIATDIETANGVIHVIDTVILPKS